MLRLLAMPMIRPVLPSKSRVIGGSHYHSDSTVSMLQSPTDRSVGLFNCYGTAPYIYIRDCRRESVWGPLQHNGFIQLARLQYRAFNGGSGFGTRSFTHYHDRALQSGPRRTIC